MNLRRLRASVVALALVPALAGACAPTHGAPSGTASKLNTILTQAQRTYGLNALIFSATMHAEPMLRVALGNSTPGVPATTGMHFRIGMPAEQFEVTMLLQLVDQDRVLLNAKTSTWFHKYPYADRATLRMLAASSSGFGDYVYGPADPTRNIPSFADVVEQDPHHEFTTRELIRRSEKPYQVPKFDTPGKNWAYSHTNYAMLGSVLETVSSLPYAVLLQRMILDKLGLRDTAYASTPAIQAPVLHAFTNERGKYEDSTAWSPSWTSFSGSINSTVCDLAAWEQAFGTGALLTPQSAAQIAATTNVGMNMNASAQYFGLGTLVSNGWLLSSGNFFGWHTATAYYPPLQIALVLTGTAGPGTKNADAVTNVILSKVSRVLTPTHAIVFPSAK